MTPKVRVIDKQMVTRPSKGNGIGKDLMKKEVWPVQRMERNPLRFEFKEGRGNGKK